MSEWHYNWKAMFPLECREVQIVRNDIMHIADVFINNTVIEFQHSHISEENFKNRNVFYPKYVGRLFWIFDMTNHVKEIKDGYIKLKQRNDLFKDYDLNKVQYGLLFEHKGVLYQIKRMDTKTGLYEVNGNPLIREQFIVFIKLQWQRVVYMSAHKASRPMVPRGQSNMEKLDQKRVRSFKKSGRF